MIPARSASATQSAPPRPSRAIANGRWARSARRAPRPRRELQQRRRARQREIDAGRLPDFLPEPRHIRDRDWTVAPIRPDLLDRRVEITGPVERKMMINALNSGANVFMADFEDANAP